MSTAVKIKSRKQTIYEYFEMLQVEYVVAILRSRIYTRTIDQNYWVKVAELKKRSINQVADRNTLPTIFTDPDMMRRTQEQVYINRTPQFFYRDEEFRKKREYWDLFSYYSIGSEVRFDLYGETKVGYVKSYTPFDNDIVIALKNSSEQYKMSVFQVFRIL